MFKILFDSNSKIRDSSSENWPYPRLRANRLLSLAWADGDLPHDVLEELADGHDVAVVPLFVLFMLCFCAFFYVFISCVLCHRSFSQCGSGTYSQVCHFKGGGHTPQLFRAPSGIWDRVRSRVQRRVWNVHGVWPPPSTRNPFNPCLAHCHT